MEKMNIIRAFMLPLVLTYLCVAVCCSVLQCVQYFAMCCSVLQCVAVCCSVFQCLADVLRCVAVC